MKTVIIPIEGTELQATITIDISPVANQEPKLLQLSDLEWQGAFRLPVVPFPAPISSFEYGGTAIAYESGLFGNTDWLFMVGHDQQQKVAQIIIPEIRNSLNLTDLAIASTYQGFSDPTDGHMNEVDPKDAAVGNKMKIGGMLCYKGQLIVSVYSYYD